MYSITLILSPKEASDLQYYLPKAAENLKIDPKNITGIRVTKRSIDARGKRVVINLKCDVYINEKQPDIRTEQFQYENVSGKQEVIIVGAGPGGLFAALRLIEKGIKPIIFERGKPVSERKRDVAQISRNNPVNSESNYCFGEGGAGTFSDGKLYTRSQKRGNTQRILEILQYHGADEAILTDAHPHIGTNKLPVIIVKIRETILNCGGEIHFNSRVSDFIIENSEIKGISLQNGEKYFGKAVILATGHSARDIYEKLHEQHIPMLEKPFAMGVRVEHPQGLIDSIQYSCDIRDEYLPAASYSLVTQVEGRGVYSFCMCPGGFIVPAATGPEELVVNGMSPAKRNSEFANSGLVVEIQPEDFPEREQYGILAGLKFQQNFERMAFMNGGQNLTAPAQLIPDFIKGKLSQHLPDTSYHPGIISSPMHFWFPENISKRLQIGFKTFGQKMPGFNSEYGVAIGVESRTSSTLRIPRNEQTLQHISIKNLYPCGEGAGYAGGIVSAAVDGERCAQMISALS